MKKQEYIVYIVNDKDRMIDFERFSCKKLATVIKHMNILFQDRLYRICTPDAVAWKVYKTPDGINRDENPVYIHTL